MAPLSVKNISPWLESIPDKRRFPVLSGSAEVSMDAVVIGGGIAGVMAAKELCRSGLSVVLLEKNHIGTGDSGLTTGFLTRVPDTSASGVASAYDVEFLKKLFSATRETQKSLFDFIRDEKIECDFLECDSYYSSYASDDSHIDTEWESYRQADPLASLVSGGAVKSPLKKSVKFSEEGRFHSRKFLFAIAERLQKKGVKIFEESEVTDVSAQEDVVLVKCGEASIRAKKVVVAVGNPSTLFPELSPLIDSNVSYVLACEYADEKDVPISKDLFWDTNEPYFYYRLISDRTLILGGCDIAADKTAVQKPYELLEQFAREQLNGGDGKMKVTHRWSGSIFHTSDGLPYAFPHPHADGKIFVAMGFGGNGLVMGMMTGRSAAKLAMGKSDQTCELLSLVRTGVTVQKVEKPTSEVVTGAGGGGGAGKTEKLGFVLFAAVSEFVKKPLLSKMIGGKKIAVFKNGGNFFALDNACSHAGGSLGDGTYDGKIVECPLHGAKFEVATGAVAGPPAVRPQKKYPVRVNGENVEVNLSGGVSVNLAKQTGGTESVGVQNAFVEPHLGFWSLLKFSFLSLVFWFAQFLMQYYWLTKEGFGASLLRSFGLAGATFFAAALFSSALFKWWPRLAVHWRIRRRFGVAGFLFLVFHVLSALHFYFDYDLVSIYYSWNPIENPIIFGSIAFPIFFVMAATSTDWAVNTMTPKVWKFVHRFVYLAYISSIFHFITINPSLLNNPPGYLLLLLTAAALFGQIYWFFRIAWRKRFLSVGSLVGITLILATIVTVYLVYRAGRLF